MIFPSSILKNLILQTFLLQILFSNHLTIFVSCLWIISKLFTCFLCYVFKTRCYYKHQANVVNKWNYFLTHFDLFLLLSFLLDLVLWQCYFIRNFCLSVPVNLRSQIIIFQTSNHYLASGGENHICFANYYSQSMWHKEDI